MFVLARTRQAVISLLRWYQTDKTPLAPFRKSLIHLVTTYIESLKEVVFTVCNLFGYEMKNSCRVFETQLGNNFLLNFVFGFQFTLKF